MWLSISSFPIWVSEEGRKGGITASIIVYEAPPSCQVLGWALGIKWQTVQIMSLLSWNLFNEKGIKPIQSLACPQHLQRARDTIPAEALQINAVVRSHRFFPPPPPPFFCFINSWEGVENVNIFCNMHLPSWKGTENPWIRLNLAICSVAICTELCSHSFKASSRWVKKLL